MKSKGFFKQTANKTVLYMFCKTEMASHYHSTAALYKLLRIKHPTIL